MGVTTFGWAPDTCADMSELLGRRPAVEEPDATASVVSLDDDDAASVFDVLAVDTARAILAELAAEPAAASGLADTVDASIQTVVYHLERLEEAGLVEVVDTWYSSKGREMDVYASTGVPVVVRLGPSPDDDALVGGSDDDGTDARAPAVGD